MATVEIFDSVSLAESCESEASAGGLEPELFIKVDKRRCMAVRLFDSDRVGGYLESLRRG